MTAPPPSTSTTRPPVAQYIVERVVDEQLSPSHSPDTRPLAASPLYLPVEQTPTSDAHLDIVYKRAQAVSRVYGLTPEDIVYLRPKLWALHADLIATKDGAVMTLLTIQYNLAAGTLAPFAFKRPELRPLLKDIMDFNVSAQYLLSEVGHGLDSPNLDTTATLQLDGSFVLHTPSRAAAKWMPPTGPKGGMPRVAIIMARLVVAGENHGVRPFVVALGNGKEMAKGVSARLLPKRAGSNPVDHAITYFDHVHLPKEALLGSLQKPADMRLNFMKVIWRVTVGSLALSNQVLTVIRVSAYIAGRYSLRRTVTGPGGKPMPIISFRTQQLPIFHALAQAKVLDAYAKDSAQRFSSPDADLDPRVRYGIAAAFKAVMMQHCQSSLFTLAERCGAQGLFEYNQIIQLQLEMRGVAIAEGDVLALCIRLASELLLNRYEMPEPADPTSLLAQHEAGLFDEARSVAMSLGTGHRSDAFNRLILPLCQPLIEAIGHRMAYEAAMAAHVDPDILKLYVANALKHDASWYVQHGGLTRREIADMEDRAVGNLLGRLEELLEDTGAEAYVHAPIVSDEGWNAFVDRLPRYSGVAEMSLISGSTQSARKETVVGAKL
ncbi:hypothetical protein EIP91_001139 [Steccherinum ochraceum]|uniref:Acyl-CoA oxidase C-alpha1 domain-containing protein n=1 Tax=Steccherinum ochraceum TaxID=92696 RepID=A0A4R0RHH7_9APHY|nr:hypothetical protein EIP91_001139 [Steccherinum ochraceum]